MTLVIPTGFAEAALEFRMTGDPQSWFITCGIDVSDASGDGVAMAHSVTLAWQVSMLESMDNTVQFVSTTVHIGSDGGSPGIAVDPAGFPGRAGAAMLPQNCALLIDKFTGTPGRRGRGRMFIPGVLAEGQVDNVGVISNSKVVDLQSQATLFFNELVSHTLGDAPSTPMVLLHNPGTSAVPSPSPVTSLHCQPTISTQRRRLR